MTLSEKKYYNTYALELSCTKGRLDDDVGTFMVSAILTSNNQNRYMTAQEKIEALKFIIDGLSKHLEDCKKEVLVKELSGVGNE